MKLRNICTIAHVDHGKTTLVDFLLRQSNTFQAHEVLEERVMDKDDIERERGITIMAKNAAFTLADTKVNIVDTPGHADFGGEVERIMGMVDGAILLVDAAEGPLPQTRFVLQKAIKKGLRVILCINKVDRPEVQNSDLVHQTVDKTFDLFVELGASDEQCDFPIVYACAREGWCTRDAEEIPALISGEKKGSLRPLFDLILGLPKPNIIEGPDAQLMVANISYSEYVGAMALGKLLSGTIKKNQTVYRWGMKNGAPFKDKFQAAHLYSFTGLEQIEVDELRAGDIGWVSGCNEYEIGDTIVSNPETPSMERIKVEAPTLRILFSINTSPYSGKEGKAIQSRELRTRLINETRNNPALKLEETEQADQYYLLGRGELQFAILIERMRREGLEFMVGKPNVLMKRDENGKLLEPMEKITLDLLEAYSGDVTRLFQGRKGRLLAYEAMELISGEPRVRLIFEIPTRGLLGTHSHYLTATRGSGLISAELNGYVEYQGDIAHRSGGAIISDRAGKSTAYALESVQDRGVLFIGEGVDLYEGMIIGEAAKDNDLNVNACRPKKLTNIRTTASDGIVMLNGVKKLSLEACIEWIDEDEWIEVTPKTVRIRKKVLAVNARSVKREDRVRLD